MTRSYKTFIDSPANDKITKTIARILHGDCLEELAKFSEASIDAIVTDPPYGLGFMGKEWDSLPPGREWADECLRVLKPGGHLLAFGGTRTWHRLAVAVEDAGFEIRDSIAWMYGSGFPKSLDVSKAIDKAGRPGMAKDGSNQSFDSSGVYGAGGVLPTDILAPATDAARQWSGWGTALKPAFEPVVVARKPLVGTVAANVLQHGTGALNIDGCRVAPLTPAEVARSGRSTNGEVYGDFAPVDWKSEGKPHPGRWPTNVILGESQAAALDEQSGFSKSPPVGSVARTQGGNTIGTFAHEGRPPSPNGHGDSGGASRFFYIARKDEEWHTSLSNHDTPASSPCTGTPEHGKSGPARRQRTTSASAKGRHVAEVSSAISGSANAPTPTLDSDMVRFFYCAKAPKKERPTVNGVSHPTVKPLALMRYLVRLVTPPGGTVLDPFAGSGATIEAALLEGFAPIGIERDESYLPLIQARIDRVTTDEGEAA